MSRRPVTCFTPNALTELEVSVLDRAFGRRLHEASEYTRLAVDSGSNHGIGGPAMKIKEEVYNP